MDVGHTHLIDRLAFVAGILSGIALLPQVIVTLMSGDVGGISLTTFLIIALNSVVWVLYAMHRGLLALGIASLLNFFFSAALVLAYVWYSLPS